MDHCKALVGSAMVQDFSCLVYV